MKEKKSTDKKSHTGGHTVIDASKAGTSVVVVAAATAAAYV